MVLLIAIVSVAIIVFAIVKPAMASVLIWPVLYMYPHNLWYQLQVPFNIGFDDLYALVIFGSVLIRYKLFEGRPLVLGWPCVAIVGFVAVFSVSQIAGAVSMPGERLLQITSIRLIPKYMVIAGLSFALLQVISTDRILKTHLISFACAAAGGGLIIIVQYFQPGLTQIFTPPVLLEERGWTFEEGMRAAGTFGTSNIAGVMMVASMFLLLPIAVNMASLAGLFYGTAVLFSGTSIGITRSRTAAFAGLVVTIGLIIFSKNRGRAAMLIVAGALVLLLFPGVRESYVERIAKIFSRDESVEFNVAERFQLWRTYLAGISFQDLFVGKGLIAGRYDYGGNTHNLFISLIAVYGIPGVAWFAFTATNLIKSCRRVIRHATADRTRRIGVGVLASFCAILISGLTVDAISDTTILYVLFFQVILSARLAGQAAYEQRFAYANEHGYAPAPAAT